MQAPRPRLRPHTAAPTRLYHFLVTSHSHSNHAHSGTTAAAQPQYPPLLHPPPVTPFTSSTPHANLSSLLPSGSNPYHLRVFDDSNRPEQRLASSTVRATRRHSARLGPGPGSATRWWWHSNATTNTTSHAPPISRIRHGANFARSSKLETKTRQRRPHGPTTPTRIFFLYYDFHPKPAYPASLLPSYAPAPLSGSGDGRGGVRYTHSLQPLIRYSHFPIHVCLSGLQHAALEPDYSGAPRE